MKEEGRRREQKGREEKEMGEGNRSESSGADRLQIVKSKRSVRDGWDDRKDSSDGMKKEGSAKGGEFPTPNEESE